MSKNITIKEGGVAKNLTADKLRTNLYGGGTCLWVPEDDVQLGTKSIDENGTYKAEDDGYYGYSQVTVNVPGGAGGPPGGSGSSVVGKNGDGNEAVISVDQSGNFVETEIPSSIEVDIPPDDTAYFDGDDIDFTGMVVKAYKADGSLWTDATHPNGVLQISELILPVTKATLDSGQAVVYSDGAGLNALLAECTEEVFYVYYIYGRKYVVSNGYGYTRGLGVNRNNQIVSMQKSQPGKTLVTRYNGSVYVANIDGSRAENLITYEGIIDGQDSWVVSGTSQLPIGDGVFTGSSWNWNSQEIPTSTVNPSGKSVDDMHASSITKRIPVQYERPFDSKVLEAYFLITVTEGSGTGSSGDNPDPE